MWEQGWRVGAEGDGIGLTTGDIDAGARHQGEATGDEGFCHTVILDRERRDLFMGWGVEPSQNWE